MILSASRRINILNYDSEWFFNRIKDGFIKDLKQDKWVEMIWWESMETAQGLWKNCRRLWNFGSIVLL